jgi:hypothetical protein
MFCGHQAIEISTIHWLTMSAPLCNVIHPSVSQFEHDHFTLSQISERLKLGPAQSSSQ